MPNRKITDLPFGAPPGNQTNVRIGTDNLETARSEQITLADIDAVVTHPEEVVRDSSDLTGQAPADAKVGVNYTTGQYFYVNSTGDWTPLVIPQPVDEVILNDGPLSGSAPAGAKMGYDRVNMRIYYVGSGGSWQIHPEYTPNEDVDFTQASPILVWTINHGRGRFPDDVTIYDTAGDVVYATVENPDNNTTTITFAVPTAGRANLEFQE